MAVWVGSKGDDLPLRHRTGAPVTANTMPAQIFGGFLSTVLAGTPPVSFEPPLFVGDEHAGSVPPR